MFYTTKKCNFKTGTSQPNRTLLLGLHSLVLTAMPMNWQQVFSHFACCQPALPLHKHWCQDGGAAEAHGWANWRDVTIPVAPSKQFKSAVCIGFV